MNRASCGEAQPPQGSEPVDKGEGEKTVAAKF